MRKKLLIAVIFISLIIICPVEIPAQTSILKWQDGKKGCVSLTFDDASINQFRIAVPLLNDRGLHATFFIITGDIPGSKYGDKYIGRPVKKIIEESKTVPTDKSNLFERCTALYYLAHTGKYPEIEKYSNLDDVIGDEFDVGNYKVVYAQIDSAYTILRKNASSYNFQEKERKPEKGYHLTWDIIRATHDDGHEIANHSISHPYMSVITKPDILYEVEKCNEDIENHIGVKHVNSIELPYAIVDKRVLGYIYPLFPFVRNDLKDDYIKEILRGEPGEPVSHSKEYVQWQRGPITNTPLEKMEGWADTTITDGAWLVLVFHGVEGIGWEAIPKETYAKYFDYIKSKQEDLWVAAFEDGYKYIRERVNTKAVANSSSGKIIVSLSNNLDSEIYDLPLTLKTIVPADWRSVHIQQGNKQFDVATRSVNNENFVEYRAVPGKSRIIISKKG
jgi:peptidoglycan/xylan/chitin deacetylase (PgdA/CDA1 family)